MKINLKNCLVSTITILIMIFCLMHSNEVIKNIIDTCNIWLLKLFPNLFIMFVISDILVKTNFASFLCNLLYPFVKRIIPINKYGIYVFLTSIFTGSPGNAKNTYNLYSKGLINKEEAEKIVCYTFFPNILFLNYMSKLILGKYMFLEMFLILLISNILLCYFNKAKYTLERIHNISDNETFLNILFNSIKSNISILLSILGVMIIANVCSLIVITLLNLNELYSSVLLGIFELTSGINSLINLKEIMMIKKILFIAYFAFGGISIHLQIKSIFSDTHISIKRFFASRLVQVIICIILILVT